MGFFARLKWLFVGEGEAPSGFKSAQPSGRPDHGSRPQGYNRDRGPRDRDGRDSRGERFPRDNRDNRDNRNFREGREPRDRDRQQPPRSGGYRDGNGNSDRFNERDRGGYGPRRSGGGYSRRDSSGGEGGFPRPIERPSGGPSSTMRPAQSSVQEVAPIQVPRPEQTQGPEKIGVVMHYFDDARVASIKVEKGQIRSGDWIELQGNISSLRQKVDSMQLDNQPIGEAHEGQEVGIRVIRPVKAGDAVVRLRG